MAFLVAQPVFSQDKDKDNAIGEEQKDVKVFPALTISGTITHGEDVLAGVTIDLYEGNNVIESTVTKKNGKFKYKLNNDHIYTIDLIKEGYFTKRISINTALPDGDDNFYDFDFDIDLESTKDKNYDAQLAEYPSALIAYDRRKKEFGFDKNYTRTYFDEIEGKSQK